MKTCKHDRHEIMQMVLMLRNNLLSKTIESSDNTAIIIINLYVISDAVSSPESKDAGAMKQAVIHNVRQHSLGIVKQLLSFRTCTKVLVAAA